jgi:hypothetical protein
MEFQRARDAASWPDGGGPAHTYRQGARCDLPEFADVQRLAGSWEGEVTRRDGEEARSEPASLAGYQVLGGCALITFLDYGTDGAMHRELGIQTYNTYVGRLQDARLDNAAGTGLRSLWGESEDGVIRLESHEKADDRQRYTWTFQGADRVELMVEALDGTADREVLSGSFRRK